MTAGRSRVAGLVFAALAMGASGPLRAEPRELRYLGYAVEQGSGRYLYTEVHRHQYDGARWLGGSIRYVAPDGRELAERQLDFRTDPYVPLMRYRLAGDAEEEAITAIGPSVVQLEQRTGTQVRRVTLPRRSRQAADSGFNAYLVDQLDNLAAGREVTLSMIVLGRLDQYRFRVLPAGRLTVAGEPALRLRIVPDSLLRLLVDPLEVIYGLRSRQLLHYHGPSNLLDPASGRSYAVDIDYRRRPSSAPAILPQP